MFPVEDVLGLGIVIELPEPPSIGIMTMSTFGAETPFVLIIRLVTAHAVQPGVLVCVVQVAFFAGSDGMDTNQRKFGEIMVKKHLGSPAPLIVAALTHIPFLTFVDIVLMMTIITICSKLLPGDRPPVARIAGDLDMFVLEGIFRLIVVVDRSFPFLGYVADFALCIVTPLVSVVMLVAGIACGLTLILEGFIFVALVARYIAMLVFEGKLGFAVVVKRLLPVHRGMAGFTLFIVAVSMNVIQLVASITVEGCFLISLVGVTTVACNFYVFFLQWKFSFVVIVTGLFPTLLLVAVVTLFPEASTVGFVLFMAFLTL